MLEQIDYKTIFHYFEEISKVPRGSYHNEKISDYLVQFAKERGIAYRQEECGNVIFRKPASADCRSGKTVMMQGHMDMVCVCEDDSHDFETEGLNLQIHGDWLEAEKTTLGGDDGIALAYILAVFADDTLTHPALEAVITVDEEVGMEGASVLDASDLKADYLINIDNEEEGVLLVSCAGGASVDVFLEGTLEKQKGTPVEVCLSGLCGGHSGTEIAKHPANASILMGRLLQGVQEEIYLQTITGGDKDNVITGKTSATILCTGDVSALCDRLQQRKEQLCQEFVAAEPNRFGREKRNGSIFQCFHKTAFGLSEPHDHRSAGNECAGTGNGRKFAESWYRKDRTWKDSSGLLCAKPEGNLQRSHDLADQSACFAYFCRRDKGRSRCAWRISGLGLQRGFRAS